MSEPLTVEALAEIARTQGKRAAHEALTGRAPCVWCKSPTVGRNQDGAPLCGDYECQRDDYERRLRREGQK